MKQRSRFVLPAILVAAAAIRIIGLDSKSLWFDELYYVWINKLPLGEMIDETIAAGHPPLYDLIYHAWLSIGGGEEWVRLLSCIAGIGVVWLTYLSANELFSRRVGLWSAALAAVSPYLVWYSRSANYYSFLTLVSMLSFYTLVRACKRGGWWNWIAYATTTTLVLFTYFFGVVILVAGAGVFLLMREKENKWPAPWFASMAYLSVVTGLTYFISKLSTVESSRLHLPPLENWMPVVKMVVISPFILVSGYVDRIHVFNGYDPISWPRRIVLLLLLAGLVAVLASKKTRRLLLERRTIAVILYTFLLIAGPVSIQFMNDSYPDERFFAWATPTFLIIGAVLISRIPRKASFFFGGLLAAMLLTFSIWQNQSVSYGPDWRFIMSNIYSQRQGSDMLVCFPIHECEIAADYYMPEPLPIAGGMVAFDRDAVFFLPPGTIWGGYKSGYWIDHGAEPALAGEEFETRLNRDLSQADRLWFVVSNSVNFEKHPSIEKAIEKNWQQTQVFYDRQFSVRLYVRK